MKKEDAKIFVREYTCDEGINYVVCNLGKTFKEAFGLAPGELEMIENEEVDIDEVEYEYVSDDYMFGVCGLMKLDGEMDYITNDCFYMLEPISEDSFKKIEEIYNETMQKIRATGYTGTDFSDAHLNALIDPDDPESEVIKEVQSIVFDANNRLTDIINSDNNQFS